jgi:hypothetical protein
MWCLNRCVMLSRVVFLTNPIALSVLWYFFSLLSSNDCKIIRPGGEWIVWAKLDLVWICISHNIHGYILWTHMNEHTLFNNVMCGISWQFISLNTQEWSCLLWVPPTTNLWQDVESKREGSLYTSGHLMHPTQKPWNSMHPWSILFYELFWHGN